MDMGQAEEAQNIENPEEQVTVQHPEKLVNETPESFVNGFNLVTEIVVSYGWYVILAVVVIFYLRHRFRSNISQLMKEKSDRDYYKKYDTKTALARQEGRQQALMRMQEENDIKAKELCEREMQKEEEKKLQRIEEWENHKQGKAYRSKHYQPKEEEPVSTSQEKKPKPKSTFRPDDYNPLMGIARSNGFRPRQRSSRGG
ncbi:selenoprotein S-like [Antedon mediterranea]|uniref:selenoprotein S-like n=1 Tax=Antedon mediterranea TaxID=105859 RepID=UPI003AF5A5BE